MDWSKVRRVHTNYNEGIGHFITVITGDKRTEPDSIIRQDVFVTPEIKKHCEILKEISAQTKTALSGFELGRTRNLKSKIRGSGTVVRDSVVKPTNHQYGGFHFVSPTLHCS